MKTINLFEVGEEVYVKAIVTGMTIDQGEIKYHLKNDITGHNYDHLFAGDQLTPVPKKDVKNTDPIVETNSRKERFENGRKGSNRN